MRVAELAAPILTCEAELTESAYLLRKLDRGARALMALLDRHAVRVAFHLDGHEEAIGGLRGSGIFGGSGGVPDVGAR